MSVLGVHSFAASKNRAQARLQRNLGYGVVRFVTLGSKREAGSGWNAGDREAVCASEKESLKGVSAMP